MFDEPDNAGDCSFVCSDGTGDGNGRSDGRGDGAGEVLDIAFWASPSVIAGGFDKNTLKLSNASPFARTEKG